MTEEITAEYGIYHEYSLAPFVEKLARDWPGGRALDLGCGTGAVTLRLAERGLRVIGIDHSPEMLALARAKAAERGLDSRTEFETGDARGAPLRRRGVRRGHLPGAASPSRGHRAVPAGARTRAQAGRTLLHLRADDRRRAAEARPDSALARRQAGPSRARGGAGGRRHDRGADRAGAASLRAGAPGARVRGGVREPPATAARAGSGPGAPGARASDLPSLEAETRAT